MKTKKLLKMAVVSALLFFNGEALASTSSPFTGDATTPPYDVIAPNLQSISSGNNITPVNTITQVSPSSSSMPTPKSASFGLDTAFQNPNMSQALPDCPSPPTPPPACNNVGDCNYASAPSWSGWDIVSRGTCKGGGPGGWLVTYPVAPPNVYPPTTTSSSSTVTALRSNTNTPTASSSTSSTSSSGGGTSGSTSTASAPVQTGYFGASCEYGVCSILVTSSNGYQFTEPGQSQSELPVLESSAQQALGAKGVLPSNITYNINTDAGAEQVPNGEGILPDGQYTVFAGIYTMTGASPQQACGSISYENGGYTSYGGTESIATQCCLYFGQDCGVTGEGGSGSNTPGG